MGKKIKIKNIGGGEEYQVVGTYIDYDLDLI